MTKLQVLHEAFIEKAQRGMDFGALPIRAQRSEVPVVPMDRWREVDGSLYKTYRFREPDKRDRFIVTLLGYEAEVQHNAQIIIDEGEVSLRIRTRTAERVTELDREYAKFSDVVFKDLVSLPRVVIGSDDGDQGRDV